MPPVFADHKKILFPFQYRNHVAEMDKVATEFSHRYVVKKYMKVWQDFAIEERLLFWDKENKADEHNHKYVCL